MTTKAWAHLPNAAHIDRMLASVKKNPEKWSTARSLTHDAAWDEAREAAWDAAGGAVQGEIRNKAWDEAWDAAWNAVQGAAWGTAWGATWGATREAARDAVQGAARGGVKPISRGGVKPISRDEAWNAAWHAARGTVLALIAWDDCAYILELPEDALKVLRAVGNHQAILLSAAAHALRETSC